MSRTQYVAMAIAAIVAFLALLGLSMSADLEGCHPMPIGKTVILNCDD